MVRKGLECFKRARLFWDEGGLMISVSVYITL